MRKPTRFIVIAPFPDIKSLCPNCITAGYPPTLQKSPLSYIIVITVCQQDSTMLFSDANPLRIIQITCILTDIKRKSV